MLKIMLLVKKVTSCLFFSFLLFHLSLASSPSSLYLFLRHLHPHHSFHHHHLCFRFGQFHVFFFCFFFFCFFFFFFFYSSSSHTSWLGLKHQLTYSSSSSVSPSSSLSPSPSSSSSCFSALFKWQACTRLQVRGFEVKQDHTPRIRGIIIVIVLCRQSADCINIYVALVCSVQPRQHKTKPISGAYVWVTSPHGLYYGCMFYMVLCFIWSSALYGLLCILLSVRQRQVCRCSNCLRSSSQLAQLHHLLVNTGCEKMQVWHRSAFVLFL